jgi:hypothetical protein
MVIRSKIYASQNLNSLTLKHNRREQIWNLRSSKGASLKSNFELTQFKHSKSQK